MANPMATLTLTLSAGREKKLFVNFLQTRNQAKKKYRINPAVPRAHPAKNFSSVGDKVSLLKLLAPWSASTSRFNDDRAIIDNLT